MKPLLLLLLTMTLNIFSASAAGPDHVLTRLWDKYDKAAADDLPREQLDALSAIKEEAERKHLILDFCDAARAYVDVSCSMDWKLRDSLEARLDEELEAFGEPAATIYAGSRGRNADSLAAYIRANREKLASSANSTLYPNDSRLAGGNFGEALPELVTNDLEYALWCLHSSWRLDDSSRQLIAEGLSHYPMNALLEFDGLTDGGPDEQELREFIKKYEWKAVAMLAEHELLDLRFSGLNSAGAGSDEYLALYADCMALSGRAAASTGDEKPIARICIGRCRSLQRQLESKDIFASTAGDTLTIELRNLNSVNVRIFRGTEKILERSLDNPACSFYAPDTLTMELPELADGSYMIKLRSGKTQTTVIHEKYSISLALRSDSEGAAVYAADFMSGKPLGWCSLVLRDENGKTVAELPRLDIDGFSRLPESFTSEFPERKWGWTLQAALSLPGRDTRLSRELPLNYYSPAAVDSRTETEQTDDRLHCLLLTDRSAFNPGETVHFKTILYKGDYSHSLAGEGVRLTARLFDPEGKELSSSELITGEFSSAAGSFVLQKSRLGGRYTIRIEHEGRTLATAVVLADEFVLPTFDLSWAADTSLHLPGDRIEVKGCIKAYSGHSLGAADISFKVTDGTDTIVSGPLETDSEGNFTISFDSSEKREYAHYAIDVKVSDATGETGEFRYSLMVRPEIPLRIQPENEAEGSFTLKEDGDGVHVREARYIFTGDSACFDIGTAEGWSRPDATIEYSLTSDGRTLQEGVTKPGSIKLRLDGAGLYRLNMTVKAESDSGEEFSHRDSVLIFHLPSGYETIDIPGVKSFFLENDGNRLSLQMGASCGPVWAVAELYGDGDKLLDRKMVNLGGWAGHEGSLANIEFEHKPKYPAMLSINIFYFRDKESFSYTREFDFTEDTEALPLGFTRFLDTTSPSKAYTFMIKTEPGVECAASIFDASTESLMDNVWRKVQPWREPVRQADYYSRCGVNGSTGSGSAYGIMSKSLARANASVVMDYAETEMASAAAAPDLTFMEESGATVLIRNDFESTIAWEPFLRSDENGEIRFDFNTSDKLSRYYVQLFAHDKNFRNSTLRREMTVTLPVKVAVVEPQYLYESDSWNARVSVSNMLKSAVGGKISISFLDGGDMKTAAVLKSESDSLTVAAGSAAEFRLPIEAPETDTLGLLVSFIPDDEEYGSDAVFVAMPVKKPVQTITEAHSALYRPGMDRDALIAKLRGMFGNIDGDSASVKEIPIREMLGEAIPKELYPDSEDVLSLSAALWADNLLASLKGVEAVGLSDLQKAGLVGKIVSCWNSDGGFGWFAGMNSSPVITAVLLERFSEMGAGCPEAVSRLLPDAVGYLDSEMFSGKVRPLWCGGLSLAQYLHVRALYPEVTLDTGELGSKELKAFRKAVREYLVPGDESGLEGQIFAKARRLTTLQALLADDAGLRLAKGLGISMMTGRRLSRSLERDIESLAQYARPHVSGGYYYPNAVMPWRGLLESELYAHSMLCRLMESYGHGDIAEGIRLWTMVQKETQQWESDPGYLEALACVMHGTEETLDTKVIALSASAELPFEDIRAAGNGFTIEKEFYLNGKKLSEGDTLHVGDRLTAVYRIWSGENRSFVRLSVPRNAALRPVDQISGRYGWMARPLSVPGWTTFTPQGYRSVRADRTEYWFESYPEEKTAVSEEFFVTQEGRFQSPVPEIESLYAPHYRANGSGSGNTITVSGNQ